MSDFEASGPAAEFVVGSPVVESVGPIAFSPDGVLFLADNVRAAIMAVDLSADAGLSPAGEVEDLDGRLAAFLGCGRADVAVRDLAVHPLSGAAYLSVLRSAGGRQVPVVARIGADGVISEVGLSGVKYLQMLIDDAPTADDEREDIRAVADGDVEGQPVDIPAIGQTVWVAHDQLRATTVTDMAYVNGELLLAGASNEEFVSTFRRIRFPFEGKAEAARLEIFHVSHGRYETHSPVRTFAPYAGGASILASYTCTPVVHFPLTDLVGGTRVVGRTVADLGALSSPVDIICYRRGDEEYVLVSHTRRPLMRLACRVIPAMA